MQELSFLCKRKFQNWLLLLLLKGTQCARPKMAVRSTQGQNRAARSTQGDVTHLLKGCGINFIRSRIPDQVYCNKIRKATILCLKHLFCKNKCHSPLLHRLGTVLHSSCMWMLVFMLKENTCKCEWKPTTKYATKYICLVSFPHIHTKYLDLQTCKKLAHGGVKTFDDYICTSVNVKKCIAK